MLAEPVTTIDFLWQTKQAVVDRHNHYLGENPGGTLGTAQANPCCWLTPIGPSLANCQAPYIILWDAVSSQWMCYQQSKRTD